MAIYDPGYEYNPGHEIPWRPAEDGEVTLDEMPVRARRISREKLEPLLRFAGMLAGAECAAVALCRGEGLIIELTDPPTAWLAPGTFLRAQPPSSTNEGWSITSLQKGSMRWCWCKPPPGFASAALVRGPWLIAAQRLLLVANREGRLSEVSLGLAASYVAQAGWPATPPGAVGYGPTPSAEEVLTENGVADEELLENALSEDALAKGTPVPRREAGR
jgi:hypothetical protein